MTLLRVISASAILDNGSRYDWWYNMPRGFPRLRTTNGALNRVGARVIERRAALDIGQDDLCAKLAEVTGGAWVADRRDIYRIERARRTVTDLELIALALALNCEPHWLLMGQPEEPIDFQKPDSGV